MRPLALKPTVTLRRLAVFAIMTSMPLAVQAGTVRDDVDDSQYTTLAALSEYASVGSLQYEQNALNCQASATLIASRWVLTAAQVTTGSTGMTFTIDGGTYDASQIVSHPNWDGQVGTNGYDIALVRLTAPVTSVGPAIRYAGTAELGATATIVGYGMTGTGVTGATLSGGTKRAGQNVLDSLGVAGNYLMADFDNPSAAAESTWGSSTPLALEYSSAPGDTGGGVFINAAGAMRLAGIASFGQAGPSAAPDGSANADYGDLMGFTRVSAFNNWIDDTIAAQWSNAAGGSVHAAANYQGGWAPDSTDVLSFRDVAGAYTVSFSGANTYSKLLVRGGSVTIDLGGATQTVNSPMFNGSFVVARDSGDTASLTLTNGTLSAVDGFIAAAAGSSGTLIVSGNGARLTLTDSLFIGGNSSAAGGSGTLTTSPGAVVTVGGALKLWSANATVDNSGAMTVSRLDLAGGTLKGSGNLTVTGVSTWTAGTMDGTGTTVIPPGGTLTIGNSAPINLYRPLRNSGTIVWTGTDSLCGDRWQAAGAIENTAGATFDAQSDAVFRFMYNSYATFTNAGVLRKSGGTGVTSMQWILNNTGSVEVQQGTLSVNGRGVSPGAFNVSPGATLSVSTHDLTDARIVSAGTVILWSGSIKLNHATLVNSGTVSCRPGATVDLTEATVSGTGLFEIAGGTVTASGGDYSGLLQVSSSGTLIIAGATTLTNLTQNGGWLSGSGDLTIAGIYAYTNGTADGPGKTVVSQSGTLAITQGASSNLYRPIDNAGSVTWTTTTGDWWGGRWYAAGTITNQSGATFDLQSPGTLSFMETRPVFANAGVFKRTGIVGLTEINWTFNNTGTVDVQHGLSLLGGGTSPGTFSVVVGATLTIAAPHDLTHATFINSGIVKFYAGAFDISTVAISGTGENQFVGATVTANGSSYGGSFHLVNGSLRFDNATTVGALVQDDGIVNGDGVLTVAGSSAWTAGTMEGLGQTVISAGGTFAIKPSLYRAVYLNRTLESQGTVTWVGPGSIHCGKTGIAGTINNKPGAVFDVQENGTFSYENGALGTFNNAGLFRKSSGSLTTSVYWTFNNAGAVEVQTGTLSLNGGGTSPGSFTVASGAKLSISGHDLSNATVTNAGTVDFPEGAVTLTGVTLANSGAIVFSSGAVDLAGVAITGTGLTQFNGATVTNNGGSYGGAFKVSAGSLNLGGPTVFPDLTVSGGTLTGSGDLTVTAVARCTGGTLEGPGKTIIAPGAKLSLSNTTSALNWYRAAENRGTIVWDAANQIQGDRSGATGKIDNAAEAIFDAQANGTLNYAGNTRAVFNNEGTFQKTAGTGTTSVLWTFNNAGTVDVRTGTLSLGSVGATTGQFKVAAGATLALSGSFTLTPTSIDNNGRARLTGGSSTLAAGTYGGAYELAGATLAGSGPITFAQPFTSSGGIIDTGTQVVAATGGMLNSTISSIYLYGTLVNDGTLTWTGAGNCYGDKSGAAGTLENQTGATVDAQGDATLKSTYSPRGAFINAGLFKKSAGTGTTTVQWTLNNTGMVDVQSGTLSLTGGGTSPGVFNVAAGATLAFATHTLTNATFINAGTISFGSGIVDLTSARFSGAGLNDIAGATATLSGNNYGDRFRLSTGTLSIAGAAEIANFVQNGGTLTGSANLTLTGTSTWSTGTSDGVGKTIVPAGAMLTIANGSSIAYLYRPLENSGTITWTGTGQLRADKSGTTGLIDNKTGAIFDAQTNGTLAYSGYACPIFNNAGLFKKSGGTGATSIQWTLNNAGTVDVQSGTLNVTSGGTSPGTFQVANGATLTMTTHNLAGATFVNSGTVSFSSGSVTLTGASLYGTGLNDIAGATVTFSGYGDRLRLSSGTLSLAGLTTLVNFTQAGGTLSGGGGLATTGTSSWTSGTMDVGGTTVVMAGASLAINNSSSLYLYRVLENYGAISWIGQAWWLYGAKSTASGRIDNELGATFDAQANGTLAYSSYTRPIFNNAGLFKKSAGTGTSTVAWTFNNTGVVEVQKGTLNLTGPVSQCSGSDLTAGTWIVRSGAALSLPGSNITVNQADVTLDGAGSTFTKINTLAENQGTFTVTGGRDFTTVGLLVNSGSLNVGGGSTFVVNGNLDGDGDTIVGDGVSVATLVTEHICQDTLTINASGKVQITGSGTSVVNFLCIWNPNTPGAGSIDWSTPSGGFTAASLPDNAATAVPEPATWSLLIAVASAGMLACRRRRQP